MSLSLLKKEVFNHLPSHHNLDNCDYQCHSHPKSPTSTFNTGLSIPPFCCPSPTFSLSLPHIVAMARGHAGGHISAHQRIKDDTTPTITATGLSKAHQRAIFATSDQGITAKVRKDYRARLRRFVKFIFINYPDIFEDATILISQERRDNPAMYFYPQDHRDLKYSGMDVSYFLAFLSEMKKKDNGKIASFSHISKFYDAIKYGSKVAGHHLSLDFYSKTDTFLLCFKKSLPKQRSRETWTKRKLMPLVALSSHF